MNKPNKENIISDKNKLKAKWFKIIGSAFLLLSFIFQNYFYDKWDKKGDEVCNANRDYSNMSRASLLYLNLYFNTHLTADTETIIKRNYIHAAAVKAAQGQVTSIIVRDTNEQIKKDLCNSLLQKANTVYNFKSFLDYISFSYLADSNSIEIGNRYIKKIDDRREIARYVFLSSYIIGSIILLIGFKFE